MVAVNNITLRFGGRALLDNVSFLINREDRIGLTGRNGAGKSTLLKLLTGIYKSESGSISMPNNCTIALLSQDLESKSTKSVFDETKLAFSQILAMEKELQEITHQLETREDYESDAYMKLIERLGDVIAAALARVLRG